MNFRTALSLSDLFNPEILRYTTNRQPATTNVCNNTTHKWIENGNTQQIETIYPETNH